ncbi:MAG: hypothetical protein DRQ13_06080 [Ignavibacteriae bacterium]|nr:MAG: hypothetical protein DRQ13_06080 [Ignavibacteriota bacterium]
MNANSFTHELMQNYPNPFNPTTNINFSLKEESYVTLKVYDVLGREVDILVNGNLPAGVHSVEFNGESFESGLYFYEINTGTFRDTKKFILIK